MGVVISVAAILIPIVNVLLFALSIQRFISKRNNKRVLHKLNDEIVQRLFPLPKLRDIQEIVRKNNIAGHLENELVKSYKRVYYSFCIYLVGIIFSIALWGTCLLLFILGFNNAHISFHIICIFVAAILIWILEVSPLLNHFDNKVVRKMTNAIDCICYECISPNGKICVALVKLGTSVIILILNLFLFYGYIQLTMFLFNFFVFEQNLLSILIMLCFYQYFFIHVLAYVIYGIYYYWKNKKRQPLNLNPKYLYAMLKNNTYLLFLVFYLMCKYVQIYLVLNYGIEMIEATALLYLIDTYIAQCSACEKLKDQDNVANK